MSPELYCTIFDIHEDQRFVYFDTIKNNAEARTIAIDFDKSTKQVDTRR
jgi:hypothetical protein